MVEWNILSGFPGETDADYHEQAALVPLLHHLEPPAGGERFWLERFSPYFTDNTFPIHGVRPQSSYRHIYPHSLQHDKIAYSFEYEADHIATAGARMALDVAIEQWRRCWAGERRPSLTYQRLPETLRIIDRRSELPQQTMLTGWRAEAYQACDYTSRSPERIREELASLGYQVTAKQVRGLLEACCRAGVMASEDEQYLGLALPENPGW
ncbi:hypothetical protein JQS43_10885 [Natronosporangium hydrolyticum]|uniref:Uncharacterized protein n=1 Tax=Natronosporangium hydrolyticum TaxID=2811111 RepID=A0A895YL61_9ACTN|nr:hypothetical protein [Natronosporangium hydrolyticum]QSB16732.1 hypothetical protein JQS43_10885 [Natronosporangium hydrolyticum]